MRFSVECAFPHLGKRGASSRKSALCNLHLTEKRTLQPTSHGKMHSATYISRKGAFWPRRLTERRSLTVREIAECAFPSRCGAREVWGNPPARLRGTMENGSTGQTRSSNPPPACGAGCARARRSRFGVRPHGKAHSARPAGFRMRFSVTTRPQTALFRRMRLSSPGQTWRQLTEKRTLPPAPHGKAHSGLIDSRKGAFCAGGLTKRRILGLSPVHVGRFTLFKQLKLYAHV